jgi:hypothetical protein
MTKPNAETDGDTGPQLRQVLAPGETESTHLARLMLGPQFKNGFLAYQFSQSLFTNQPPEIGDVADEASRLIEKATAGDLQVVSQTLTAQAMALDAIFADCATNALANRGKYPDAFQRYMTMAFKAQSNCRTTLEALAKLHQPREQVVRHVHVYEGGQAVVAEEFHHHAGGAGNAGSAHQPHAPGSAIAGGTALPRPNPIGQTVPGSEGARKEPVPNARRRGGKRGA